MFRADLHLHTTFSDGTSEPEALVSALRGHGVTHAAVTDHDSVGFFRAPKPEGNSLHLFVGVEINTCDASDALHILGFGRNLASDPVFDRRLADIRGRREARVRIILESLRALGMEITFEEVRRQGRETLGRPNVADAMVAKGFASTRKDAFVRFLALGKPAYAPPEGPGTEEAIRIIREAGGLPVLAHPGVAALEAKKLSSLVAAGLAGIEAFHPLHGPGQVRNFLEAARAHGIYATCGSDYHGPRSGRETLEDFGMQPKDLAKFLEVISA